MTDSPLVRSARGHVEALERLVGRHRERLEAGADRVAPHTTLRRLAGEERRLAGWRRTLETALREANPVDPLD